MAVLTREEIIRLVGPAVDDSVILEIIATGATREDLGSAIAWLYADDAMTREKRPRPDGVVATLCDILSQPEVEIEYD